MGVLLLSSVSWNGGSRTDAIYYQNHSVQSSERVSAFSGSGIISE